MSATYMETPYCCTGGCPDTTAMDHRVAKNQLSFCTYGPSHQDNSLAMILLRNGRLQKTILFQPSELRLEKKKKKRRKRRKNAVIFLPPPAIVSRSLICPPLPPPHQPPFYACLVAQAGTREVIHCSYA